MRYEIEEDDDKEARKQADAAYERLKRLWWRLQMQWTYFPETSYPLLATIFGVTLLVYLTLAQAGRSIAMITGAQ